MIGYSGDWQRVESHLEQVELHLCNFFDIPPPLGASSTADLSTLGNRVNESSNGKVREPQRLVPETFETDEGLQLTPLGRYQVRGCLCHVTIVSGQWIFISI